MLALPAGPEGVTPELPDVAGPNAPLGEDDEDEVEAAALLPAVAVFEPPRPVPMLDGPSPGPEGLRPPLFTTFCPKKPTGGRA